MSGYVPPRHSCLLFGVRPLPLLSRKTRTPYPLGRSCGVCRREPESLVLVVMSGLPNRRRHFSIRTTFSFVPGPLGRNPRLATDHACERPCGGRGVGGNGEGRWRVHLEGSGSSSPLVSKTCSTCTYPTCADHSSLFANKVKPCTEPTKVSEVFFRPTQSRVLPIREPQTSHPSLPLVSGGRQRDSSLWEEDCDDRSPC